MKVRRSLTDLVFVKPLVFRLQQHFEFKCLIVCVQDGAKEVLTLRVKVVVEARRPLRGVEQSNEDFLD